MKLFYLILAHKNLSQLERMISALSHEHSFFFIHFDKKVSNNEIKKYGFRNNPNIQIIRSRFNINWGGYNMVKATLSLIRSAIKLKEKGYFILMSGQDFPVKPPTLIYEFLKRNYGNQFLEYFSLPNPKWNGGLERITYYWFVDKLGIGFSSLFCSFQKSSGISRPYFEGFPAYGGSQWWCITDECALYILKFLKHNKVYEEYFEHCFIPDEIFFNTLILNSHFKDKTINNNLKYVDWGNRKQPPHPRILEENDLYTILNSDCLWARKFDDSTTPSILNKIEKLLKL